ncbi:metal ABC transporter permease [Marivivens sp. LCG002]|uniref:metal ABC transporter permease n=1 Tax=Marivivens sp. LCG002 TaxID=3051171 RepID=UPI0025575F36|nr:metal ABC transporter permease [Marivivens sp. LCG002]WIV51515.1 metal ABC transporter permease [Marivivens sp. LCG002]
MFDDFLVRAALAGVGTALAAGLLGCFVVWRRMAYFGDATAHAAILGVALALGFSVSIFVGVAGIALLMALSIFALTGKGYAVDTVLGVLAHGALATGLVAVSLIPGARINLDAYLFGDVLTVSKTDLAIIWGGALVVALVLWRHWSALLTSTLNPDLAYAAGLNPRREQLVLTLLLAAVVAVSIKVVGALLITALLVIPAATARGLSRTPERMAFIAAGLGAFAALGGLGVSLYLDTPVGPSIVVVAAAMFGGSTLATAMRR